MHQQWTRSFHTYNHRANNQLKTLLDFKKVMKKTKGELMYSPTQGRQILDDLLLIWFYFSITKDQQSQQDIFLGLFQSL